jgi:short-subunit dehydrogenase
MSELIECYGPVAVVTGASSGIGRAFAAVLAEHGFDLVLVARRRDLLDAAAEELQDAHGVAVDVLQLDLAEPGAAGRVLEATAGRDVGLLVSNAGFSLQGAFETVDAGAMADMLAVNCTTSMLLAHGFVPRLRERGRGGLLLVGSVEGLIGSPFSAAYSASKAFVTGLGEALWGELTPQGLDVLTLCPGATDTEGARRHGVDPATNEHVMDAVEVARRALENIRNGPTYIPSDHYRELFTQLRSLPRRDALTAMARARST